MGDEGLSKEERALMIQEAMRQASLEPPFSGRSGGSSVDGKARTIQESSASELSDVTRDLLSGMMDTFWKESGLLGGEEVLDATSRPATRDDEDAGSPERNDGHFLEG